MLDIQLVYARDAEHQKVYTLSVPHGCTIKEAIDLSHILIESPEIQFEINETTSSPYGVGIWYKSAQLSDCLKSGDRLEIYRPLHLSAMDARQVRKQSAKAAS